MSQMLRGGQVIFGISGGCWDTQPAGGTPFHGPLTTIEQLLHRR